MDEGGAPIGPPSSLPPNHNQPHDDDDDDYDAGDGDGDDDDDGGHDGGDSCVLRHPCHQIAISPL